MVTLTRESCFTEEAQGKNAVIVFLAGGCICARAQGQLAQPGCSHRFAAAVLGTNTEVPSPQPQVF